MLQRRRAAVERHGVGIGDAKLAFLQAGRNVRVRLRINIGIDAKTDRRALGHGAGQPVDPVELGAGFHIEALDAMRQGQTDFISVLPTPEKIVWPDRRGGQHALEFAARDDIEIRRPAARAR